MTGDKVVGAKKPQWRQCAICGQRIRALVPRRYCVPCRAVARKLYVRPERRKEGREHDERAGAGSVCRAGEVQS
jgi:hypothetical protein